MGVGTIVSSGLLSIGCNFATDLLKSFGNRTRKKTIERELQKYLEEFIDLDTDSGSFYSFLNSPENKVNFKEFIRFNVFNNLYKSSDSILTREVFVENTAEQAVSYVQRDIGKKIPIDLVKRYFSRLLQIIEGKLLENINEDDLGSLYFVTQSLTEMENRIIKSIENKNIVIHEGRYESIREDYIRVLKRRNKTSHVYGIDELDLYSFYVFPNFVISKSKSELDENTSVFWNEIFTESNTVSIIGGPGFGKTLFLKNLINKHEELKIYEADKLLPIYCDLKKFKEMEKGRYSFSIEDFLVQSMIEYTGIDEREINKDFLSYFLKAGRCLILFDALDEVDNQSRDELNEKICAFFEGKNPHNKVCITSRAFGFTSKSRITFKVNPIDIHQAEEYIEKICELKYFNKGDKKEFLIQCNGLIHNAFLVSFLQLSLLVNIFKAEKELPENKIDLYEKCIEYISRKRERDQKKSNFNFKLMSSILDNDASFEKLSSLSRPNNHEVKESDVKEFLLKRYKISYISENEAANAIDEFLKFCSQRTELYVERNENYYNFYHRSFFEFFYAKYLLKEITEDNMLIQELKSFGLDSEMFEITTSILKKYDDDRYISFIDSIIKEFEDLDVSEEEGRVLFLKITLMLAPITEANFINRYYRICFSENKILSCFNHLKNNMGSEYIAPIIFKQENIERLIQDALEFYEEEIIVAYCILNIKFSKSRARHIKLNFLFARISVKIGENLDLHEYIKKFSVEDIINMLLKYTSVIDLKPGGLKYDVNKFLTSKKNRRGKMK
ncbi:hypothetical protein BK739_06540 [Bacillus thuringiensis serovar pirenaica]|uniref:NACHT domain-containing protein n=1 Tax=Bacillus thuringiensis TaxID=1428 RepID=UPI000A3882C0|nr:NACHT domain-containing protein [Bacillus thuringiensis]OUB32514.1 hypothetical protein BK739_06540 [Bacillus thuringiensis serovar pirenaica]